MIVIRVGNNMRNVRIPLFYKLFAIFILCSTIPLVTISSFMYGLSVDFLTKTISNQTMTSIEMAHQKIDKKVMEYETIIQEFQGNESIILALESQTLGEPNLIYEIIYASLIEQEIKPIVHIIDISGNIEYSTESMPESYKVGLANTWGIFRDISSKNLETVIYPQQISYSLGKKSIFSIGAKIINQSGKHIGYVLIDVPREVVLEEIKAINSALSLHIVMLDTNTYTLFDSLNPRMEGKLQRSDYLDNEKIIEHKPIQSLISEDSFLTLNVVDEKLKTTSVVNISSNIVEALKRILQLILLIGIIVSLSISCVISIIMARFISNPIKDLIAIMGKVENGSLNVEADSRSNDEIGDLGKYFNQMLNRLNDYMNKVIEKQQQLRKVEIKMLQAQIKPHFIYNTLDVIKWSAKLGQKDEVVSVVTNLARLLRFSIDCDEEFVTVKRSLDVINSYLAIQRIKYNNMFRVVNNVDEAILDYKIPRLILQPFVENAIVHGLGNNEDDTGLISINGEILDNIIKFQIIDNGIGMSEEKIQEISINTSDEHIGIHNVDQRIKIYFGKNYGVRIESKENEGTKVIITLLAQMKEEPNDWNSDY